MRCCGTIRTEGLEAYGPETVALWGRQVPLGRLGEPEEVGAVAFLASPGGPT